MARQFGWAGFTGENQRFQLNGVAFRQERQCGWGKRNSTYLLLDEELRQIRTRKQEPFVDEAQGCAGIKRHCYFGDRRIKTQGCELQNSTMTFHLKSKRLSLSQIAKPGVSQKHSLRPPCRSGGIDDIGEIIGAGAAHRRDRRRKRDLVPV